MFSGGYEKRLINILSNSKDSILAISVVGIRSKLMVLECLNVLKSFTCHNKFTWVWGHTGIVGMKLLEEGQQHIHASTQSPYKIRSYKFLTKHSGLRLNPLLPVEIARLPLYLLDMLRRFPDIHLILFFLV